MKVDVNGGAITVISDDPEIIVLGDVSPAGVTIDRTGWVSVFDNCIIQGETIKTQWTEETQ